MRRGDYLVALTMEKTMMKMMTATATPMMMRIYEGKHISDEHLWWDNTERFRTHLHILPPKHMIRIG